MKVVITIAFHLNHIVFNVVLLIANNAAVRVVKLSLVVQCLGDEFHLVSDHAEDTVRCSAGEDAGQAHQVHDEEESEETEEEDNGHDYKPWKNLGFGLTIVISTKEHGVTPYYPHSYKCIPYDILYDVPIQHTFCSTFAT
jgi:aminopeptidase-like protein